MTATDYVATQIAHGRCIREHTYQQTCGDVDYVIHDVADPQTFLGDQAAFARERDAIRALGFDEVASGEGLSVLRRR